MITDFMSIKLQEQVNGHFTIDPNLGSPKDSIKCYCEFGAEEIKTCVKVCTLNSICRLIKSNE